MRVFNSFIYDSKRLIFYESNLSNESIETINQTFPSSDKSEETLKQLGGYNPYSVQLKEGGVSQIGICLTDNCNLRCKYCFNASTNGVRDYLDVEMVEYFLLDIIKKWTIKKTVLGIADPLRIVFTGGGEPTNNWNLFVSVVDMVCDRCNEYDIPYKLDLTTNGTLSQNQIDYIKNHFSHIMLSYDGTPDIQRKNRVPADGRDYIPIIENTIRSIYSESIDITIRSTVFFDDLTSLYKMADYMYTTFMFSDWSIMPVVPMGRGVSSLMSNNKEPDFFHIFLKFREYVSTKYSSNVSCPDLSPSETMLPCGGITILGSALWLLPDGRITTCAEECKEKPCVGYVDESGVHYYDSCSDKFLEISQMKMKECRDCIAYRFCKGGCPARHIMYSHYNRENWNCKITIQLWEHIFSEILEGRECFNYKGIRHYVKGAGTVIKLEELSK